MDEEAEIAFTAEGAERAEAETTALIQGHSLSSRAKIQGHQCFGLATRFLHQTVLTFGKDANRMEFIDRTEGKPLKSNLM